MTTPDLLQLTADLVAIPSVSFDEQQIAAYIETRLRAAPHLEVTRVGDNLVARTNLGHKHRLCIAGHLDTVPVNGNAEARIDGDTLWGLGSTDMKGGIAIALLLRMDTNAAADDGEAGHFYEHRFYPNVQNEQKGRIRVEFGELCRRNKKQLLDIIASALRKYQKNREDAFTQGSLKEQFSQFIFALISGL